MPEVARSPPAPAATPVPVLAGRGSAQPAFTLAAAGGRSCCRRHRSPRPEDNKLRLRGRGRPGPGGLRCGRQPAWRHCAHAGSGLPAEAARTPGGCRPSLCQLGCAGWMPFFQCLFLIPLLLETPKNPSVTGFPLRFKGTRGFHGVVPRWPDTHTRAPSSGAAPSGKDTLYSVNNVSELTRQKVIALNNSLRIASAPRFHF